MTPDFYAWCRSNPTCRAYDVAGSYMRYLLDTYGAKRVRSYYTGTPVQRALGAPASKIEAAWREMLRGYEIPAEVALLLRESRGETVTWARYDGVPDHVRGKPEDWVDLAAASLHPEEGSRWSRTGTMLQGANGQPAWRACELGDRTYGDCVLAARVLTPVPVPIQVRLGASNQVMLVGNGVFLHRGDTAVAMKPHPMMGPGRTETEILVLRRGDRIRVWIDGRLALDGPATTDPARPGVGLHTGEATFTDLRVRAWEPR
jgi:hypothetical protein